MYGAVVGDIVVVVNSGDIAVVDDSADRESMASVVDGSQSSIVYNKWNNNRATRDSRRIHNGLYTVMRIDPNKMARDCCFLIETVD